MADCIDLMKETVPGVMRAVVRWELENCHGEPCLAARTSLLASLIVSLEFGYQEIAYTLKMIKEQVAEEKVEVMFTNLDPHRRPQPGAN